MNRSGYPPLFKMKKGKYRIAVYHASCYNRHSSCLKWAAALMLFVFQAGFCVSLDLIDEGKKLLLSNNPDKAILIFQQAETEGAADPVLNLYLGVAYLRAGQYADAEQRLSAGKAEDTARRYLYSYNLGNCYYMQNRFIEAESEYTLALQMRHTYPPAVLNRANTRIQLQKYTDALQDYKLYVMIEPVTPQTPMIQQMIRTLEQHVSVPAQGSASEMNSSSAAAAGAAAIGTGVAGTGAGAQTQTGAGTPPAGTANTGAAPAAGTNAPAQAGNTRHTAAPAAGARNTAVQPVSDAETRTAAEKNAAAERYRRLQAEVNATLPSVDNASSLSAGLDETMDYSEDYNIE